MARRKDKTRIKQLFTSPEHEGGEEGGGGGEPFLRAGVGWLVGVLPNHWYCIVVRQLHPHKKKKRSTIGILRSVRSF